MRGAERVEGGDGGWERKRGRVGGGEGIRTGGRDKVRRVEENV